jgi:hypothetical protein
MGGVKIKQIGSVELWRDEYTDAKLKVETANAFANPKTQFNNQKERTEYEIKYSIPLRLLTSAISIVPVMAEMAIARLTSLIMDRDVTSMGISSQARETSVTNTILALYKYFNLPHDPAIAQPERPSME